MTAHPANMRPAPPSDAMLAKNLHALSIRSQAAASAIARCTAPCDAQLHLAPNGQLTGFAHGRQLASLRDPGHEAKRFARGVDLESTACAVVMGFGVGHHVGDLSRRLQNAGIVVAFEPDVALLREVLSRADYADVFLRGNVVVLTDAHDTAALTSALSGSEGLLAIGTRLLTHPPSKARLGTSANEFGAAFAHVMKAVRTHVLTTLVQVEATVRNQLQNIDHYTTRAGLDDLRDAGVGRPAIVISAGPSLARQLHLLENPAVRDRFLLIAVQTVLKPLLERGIRPHFVTALDHHEISKRFYEGLTPSDVEGITLVAEAKSNPAILDAYPGEIRMPADGLLDRLLGAELSPPRAELRAGATVAHLAYYLARFLGCDPVILIGQDLAFTDGQYYAAHAAIHQVWGGELGEFRTLEMFEWERIARMKHLLRAKEDIRGRKVYTDEQMSTYLVQFERDFAEDAQLGRRTIDATEGGVRKRHTEVMSLVEALHRHRDGPAVCLSPTPQRAGDRTERLARVREHLARVRDDATFIAKESKHAATLLDRAKACVDRPREADALIQRVHEIRDEVTARGPAYYLAHFLNQAGTLNRFKADRLLLLDKDADEPTKLRRQFDRDITNVTWLGDSASNAARLLDSACGALLGQPKVTRDLVEPSLEVGLSEVRRRVVALVHADTLRGGLGTPRDLLREVTPGLSTLALTLRRLARSREIDGIVLLTDDPARIRGEAEHARASFARHDLPLTIAPVEPTMLRRNARPIAVSRLFARDSWRGGLASLSVYDEVLRPGAASALLERLGADAAALVGADWALLDPTLLDAAVARYREQSDRNPMTFVHAPPGLGSCVVDRAVLGEWSRVGGLYATVGAMLGYLPAAPQADPISKPACISVSAGIRDLGLRLIADGDEFYERVMPRLARGAEALVDMEGEEVARALRDRPMPRHLQDLTITLAGAGHGTLSVGMFERILNGIPRDAATTLTLVSDADPLRHDDWDSLLARAREASYGAIHVRTPLWGDPDRVESLLRDGPDIISVDMHSEKDEVYRQLCGRDLGDLARANLELLLSLRASTPGIMPMPFVVPRMVRRDAVYDELEGFYERSLLRTGVGVIDPLASPIEGERIAPLPLPTAVRARLDATRLIVSPAGVVTRPSGALVGTLDSSSLKQAMLQPTPALAPAA